MFYNTYGNTLIFCNTYYNTLLFFDTSYVSLTHSGTYSYTLNVSKNDMNQY